MAQDKEEKVDIFAYGESENMRPEPFRARFIPRTENHREFISREAGNAEEFLRAYEGDTKVRMEDLEM